MPYVLGWDGCYRWRTVVHLMARPKVLVIATSCGGVGVAEALRRGLGAGPAPAPAPPLGAFHGPDVLGGAWGLGEAGPGEAPALPLAPALYTPVAPAVALPTETHAAVLPGGLLIPQDTPTSTPVPEPGSLLLLLPFLILLILLRKV